MPETAGAANAMWNQPPPTVIPVAGLTAGHLGTVEGRVEEVSQIRKAGKTTRIVVIGDTTGELRVKFSPPAGSDMRPSSCCRSPESRADPATDRSICPTRRTGFSRHRNRARSGSQGDA